MKIRLKDKMLLQKKHSDFVKVKNEVHILSTFLRIHEVLTSLRDKSKTIPVTT